MTLNPALSLARPWVTMTIILPTPTLSQSDLTSIVTAFQHLTDPHDDDTHNFTYKVLDGCPFPARAVEIYMEQPRDFSITDWKNTTTVRLLVEKKFPQGTDVIWQLNSVFRRNKRLCVFDMDSTLIQQEVIDEIADYVGVKAQVAEITERAMNGELDFDDSLRARAALLKGVSAGVFDDLKKTITFTPGVRETVRVMQRLGWKTAVLSGGFVPLANWVKDELGLDYAYANTLEVSDDGKELTGNVTGDIVNGERKAMLLETIAKENGIALTQCVAIGDGANDLLMMKKAGFGIAFNAKPAVRRAAPAAVNTESMLDVLHIFGYTKGDLNELLAI